MEIQSFKDFKNNNPKGDILTTNDIIKCIQKNGVIYAEIVKDLKNHNEKNPLTPVDVDEDGFITIEHKNKEYSVKLEDVKRIEF
jgi:nitrogen fixation/metabolism regulation signal transduction histidine kinase